MNDIFQIPGTIIGIKTMAQWTRITVDTDETVTPEQIAQLWSQLNKRGYFTHSVRTIEASDIIDLPPLKERPEDDKSPSQRMRAILWRLWNQDSENIDDFEVYYHAKMERFIEHLKGKLT